MAENVALQSAVPPSTYAGKEHKTYMLHIYRHFTEWAIVLYTLHGYTSLKRNYHATIK